MINLVLEGPRGTGKSTVARYVREQTTNSTLINYTGIDVDGEMGLNAIADYYAAWTKFFRNVRKQDLIFIHDRYFFSEYVYSALYKSYDFSPYFEALVEHSWTTYDKMIVFYLYVEDPLIFQERLNRNKVKLFAHVDENVKESLIQQAGYNKLFTALENDCPEYMEIVRIKVDNRSVEDIGDEILSYIK